MTTMESGEGPPPAVLQKIETANSGDVNVFVQGDLKQKDSRPVFLTVHDLGDNARGFSVLTNEPLMSEVMEKSIWLHFEVPGQGTNAPDWPNSKPYPTLDQIAVDLKDIMDKLGIKYAVGVGEGVGANILARLAMAEPSRLIGLVLVHPTSTSAGLTEIMKDKWRGWRLKSVGMNPSMEQYLVSYRYGQYIDESEEKDALLKKFANDLKRNFNPRNLEKFLTSFSKRSDISKQLKEKLTCDVLIAAGSKSSFLHTTNTFYENCNPKRSSFLKVDDVGDVMNQATGVFARSVILFVKGIGILTSVSIPGIERQRSFSSGEGRGRHPSMSEADDPAYYARRASQCSNSDN